MKILIVGSGAVGLGLAAFLINSRNRVTLFARNDSERLLKQNGFNVSGIFGNFEHKPNNFETISSYTDITDGYDYILITAKTLANREIAKNLSTIKNTIQLSKIVVIQNGWGNSEIYGEYFSKEQIYTARIITGFFRKSYTDIEITVHADTMFVGNIFKKELSTNVKPLSDALNEGGFDCSISEDVDKHLWAKMLYNCALNPLGAVLNVEYGKLSENEYSKNIMNRIIDEIYEAMELNGFSTFLDKNEYKEVFYKKLIPSTYSHKSSMLQDLINKRKTEIDSLNGIVVELGRKHNKNFYYNSFIVDTIKAKESML